MSGASGFQVDGDAPTAYERHASVFMTPLITELLDRAEPALGSSLLDVACGTGLVARAAARRVGRDGRVAGVDVNEAMLAAARDLAGSRPPVIEWHAASADALPFNDGEFDTVLAQQGIQFFPDLAAATGELVRVTRSGGTVAVTAWTRLEDSPYFHAQRSAMAETLGEEAVAGYAEAFTPDVEPIRDAFVAAGLSDVRCEVLAPEVTLPGVARFAAAHIASTPWGPAFAAAPADQQKRIGRRISDLLLEDTIDGAAVVPFSSWLVTGTR